ncbi:uncharacterized protein LOC108928497 isoform X2 [Scleropages formosus]|uniref:uncharacterized protein LOC108928497 isoform X2 n=1 Tax=Scleropages formosus TaxID=113540 RepID=UPI0010FAA7BE|nr:uncharacterized protein LOC108928497 isoform X2 [Scleropages formosus]
MALVWERDLQEPRISASVGVDQQGGQGNPALRGEAPTKDGSGGELLHFSEEVIILILKWLDPFSLLKVGSTCWKLFRICSCNSLWRHHFQVSFGAAFPSPACPMSAKEAFRLLFMWKTLYRNVQCNPSLLERLVGELPYPPATYWMQWLVLEESVPLPALRLGWAYVEGLWGIPREELEENQGAMDEENILWFEWKDLYHLAVLYHGGVTMVFQYVLNKQCTCDHSELETLFQEYRENRFHWRFVSWLFHQPEPLDKQLRAIYLQWRPHCKRKVSYWGQAACDVPYLASLHPIASDFCLGKLAQGDENNGIQTLENYFSMCKSLVAWILGRDWGRMKRRKVYEDTLEGVYRQLRNEMCKTPIDHDQFWQVAKVQMTCVCTLLDATTNYVNWSLIKTLPYYRKRQVHDWVHLEENAWIMQLVPEALCTLLEFDTKMTEDILHGDSLVSQLSRVLWLYLHSGQHVYLDSLKSMLLTWANANMDYFSTLGAASPSSHPVW